MQPLPPYHLLSYTISSYYVMCMVKRIQNIVYTMFWGLQVCGLFDEKYRYLTTLCTSNILMLKETRVSIVISYR